MIGSDYEVLSPVRRQVIIWIYVELIFIWLLWENGPEFELMVFFIQNIEVKLNVLKQQWPAICGHELNIGVWQSESR